MGLWNRLCGGADIVRFKSGGYGVRVGAGPSAYFVSPTGERWHIPSLVLKYCVFPDLEAARNIVLKRLHKREDYHVVETMP